MNDRTFTSLKGECCAHGSSIDCPANVRLHELEAEIEHSRQAAMSELAQIQNEFFREKARAEKAEAHVRSFAGVVDENNRLKARVAELETWILAYDDWSLQKRKGAKWPGDPQELFTAREREE